MEHKYEQAEHHQNKQAEHEIKSVLYHTAAHDAHHPLSIRMTAAVTSKMHKVAAKRHRRKAAKIEGEKYDVAVDNKEDNIVNDTKQN